MTELPTSFGKYYLTEKLATGGMAEIYLAKIIGPGGFEKPVVIKQILPKLSGQRHFVDLFVAEAKTLVTLTHGNIVPVYELGVIDETYFIAMDYIDGPTLYRLTETMSRRESRMEPAVAAWITARMLEGLDYAHRKGEGVIHRDLSPRNVMLSRDGEVKLVDFGVAVTLGDPGEAGGSESAPTGSFPYMSPEQVRREPLSGQTDLFSVGVLAWEMLTGKRLFHRPDAATTLGAVQHETIPHPSAVQPEIPARLDDVVMRALERDRDRRWQNAADMLAALNKYLYSLDETPGPREVAALVARFCPPETRRLPTHLEAIAHDVLSPEPLGDDPPSAPVPSGPSTAVIPRDQAAKGRPQRQKSFATNVDLKVILDGGELPSFAGDSGIGKAFEEKSDLLPAFDAVEDTPTKQDRPDKAEIFGADTVIDDPPSVKASPPRATTRSRSVADEDLDDAPIERPIRRTPRSVQMQGEAPRPSPERTNVDGQPLGARGRPPSRTMLVLAGVGATGLALGAIYVFLQNRDRVMAAGDGGVDAEDPNAIFERHAHEPDALPPLVHDADAGVVIDAAPPARDAGHRIEAPVRIDAGGVTDAAVAKGSATLRLGADPWGEIYIDGKSMGRTPRELSVSAGHHTVEIVFPAETPPRKQTFAVDLANGETKPLQADFSH